MPIIAIEKISKSFGEKKVLDDVSLEIEQGEIFGLLGSNGAGKSTLTSIALDLQNPSSGNIYFFNKKKFSEVKQSVSLVPQDTAFYKDFSVKKNLRFFASIYGLKNKMADKRVEYLLDWLFLRKFSDTRACFLSGGYQRLLNIAIALIHDPEIIFLDEPTVGLDPNMRKKFWEKIKSLKAAGKTIILTTHYMDEAEELCSRLALMKNGKIISMGKPSDLIKIHGGIKVMIFDVENGVSGEDIQKLRTVLHQQIIVSKNNLLFIPFEQEHSIEKVVAITEWLIKKGYNILSSTTKEPSLEDVFINLTGELMEEKK
jgi:ABC-2 type transport system ATP-binding protein